MRSERVNIVPHKPPFFRTLLAAPFPFLFPVDLDEDFVSFSAFCSHEGNRRLFCNKGAGCTGDLDGVIVLFMLCKEPKNSSGSI